MTTSIMIHNAIKVTTGGVSYDNANAITLTIQTGGDDYGIVLFNLPTHIAKAIDDAIGQDGISAPQMSEQDIRADERRKISDELRNPF